MVEGGCNCGAVTYESDIEVSDVYICHCSICRNSTGSGGVAVSIVQTNSFRWVTGFECISYWSKPGQEWHTNFCKVCGSALPGVNDEDNMYIPVGTIKNGDDNLKVVHHLYVNSKSTWEEIGDSGEQHPEAYGSWNARQSIVMIHGNLS